MKKWKNISPSFSGFITWFLTFSFHQAPWPGWTKSEARQCHISFYEWNDIVFNDTHWKQDSYNPKKYLERECKFKPCFQYLEGEGKYSLGNKPLSQKVLLEGRRVGRGREGEEEKEGMPGEGTETEGPTEDFPGSTAGLDLVLYSALGSFWKVLKLSLHPSSCDLFDLGM